MIRHAFYMLVILLMLMMPASGLAQETQTFITLFAPENRLQTGQYYDLEIQVENVLDLQVVSAEIAYDPALLFVAGTRSGSPVQPGEFIGGNNAFVVRNRIQDSVIKLTFSRIRPQTAVSGSGTIGVIRVYPLSAGTTQLSFQAATLTALAEGSDTPQELAYTPVLLELSIEGETVPVPDEATATPRPTLTALPDVVVAETEPVFPTETALVNITRAPMTATVAPVVTPVIAEAEAVGDTASLLMIGAMVAIVAGVLGLIGLVISVLRRR